MIKKNINKNKRICHWCKLPAQKLYIRSIYINAKHNIKWLFLFHLPLKKNFFSKSQNKNITENTPKPHLLEEQLKVGLYSGCWHICPNRYWGPRLLILPTWLCPRSGQLTFFCHFLDLCSIIAVSPWKKKHKENECLKYSLSKPEILYSI